MRKQSDEITEAANESLAPSDKGDGGFLQGGEAKLQLPPAPRTGGLLPPGQGGAVRRDWAAALDLINEACEAVKMSEQRAKDAESYNLSLVQSHSEQLKRAETRAQAAESRAEGAERRAAEAEEWLLLFHDTIVAGVKGVLDR
jgi:hypothetical protein